MTRERVPRPRRTQPAGEFMDNGDGGCHFVQAKRWLWQYWPWLKLWVVID